MGGTVAREALSGIIANATPVSKQLCMLRFHIGCNQCLSTTHHGHCKSKVGGLVANDGDPGF